MTDPTDRTEERLRAALEARAAAVEPAATDVSSLEARVAAERRSTQRRRWVLAAAAVVAVVAAVAGAVLLANDGDDRTDVATEGDTTTTTQETSTTSTTTTTSSTTTTTTTLPALTDDGVQGWPGNTSRMFDDPQAAALFFVTEVLGFADPSLADVTSEGADAEVVYHARPTASISTTVSVHDTGTARGWVVVGLTSNAGGIDAAARDGSTVTLSGSASAFEATVAVRVLDQEGNVLAESFTMAGANGEQGPYEATIEVDPAAGTPFWVMIGEGDASGEGDFVWAATATI